MNTQRLVATLFATAAVSGVAAGAASADSIAYIKGGNVWLTTGDASHEFQVTSTGSYSAVSQADDGTLLATAGGDLRRLDRMGTVLSDIKTPVSDDPGTGPSSSITPPSSSPTVRATRATRSRSRPSAPVIRRGGSPTPTTRTRSTPPCRATSA